MPPKKKPQDRRPKQSGLDRLRAEAAKSSLFREAGGQVYTIAGRLATVTVTTIDPFDWDAEVHAWLREGDYMSAFLGMLSPEDGQRLRAAKPTLGVVMAAALGYATTDDPETPETSPGESQAS